MLGLWVTLDCRPHRPFSAPMHDNKLTVEIRYRTAPPFPVSSVMYNTVFCVLTPDVFSNSELICRLPCMELGTITVERRKRTPKENPVHISL